MLSEDRLFTPRFFVMCGFSFTVFLSVFQIFPIAPFHIIDLGGSTFASGSGLLSAGGAYMTSFLPERRRAEGIGYWGLASVAAVAVAPNLGFWIYDRGWL